MRLAIRPLLVALTLAAACSSADDAKPSRAECEQLAAHVADVVVALGAPTGGDPTIEAELAKHRANLTTAGGEAELARCMAGSRKRFACMRAASSREALAACDGS